MSTPAPAVQSWALPVGFPWSVIDPTSFSQAQSLFFLLNNRWRLAIDTSCSGDIDVAEWMAGWSWEMAITPMVRKLLAMHGSATVPRHVAAVMCGQNVIPGTPLSVDVSATAPNEKFPICDVTLSYGVGDQWWNRCRRPSPDTSTPPTAMPPMEPLALPASDPTGIDHAKPPAQPQLLSPGGRPATRNAPRSSAAGLVDAAQPSHGDAENAILRPNPAAGPQDTSGVTLCAPSNLGSGLARHTVSVGDDKASAPSGDNDSAVGGDNPEMTPRPSRQSDRQKKRHETQSIPPPDGSVAASKVNDKQAGKRKAMHKSLNVSEPGGSWNPSDDTPLEQLPSIVPTTSARPATGVAADHMDNTLDTLRVSQSLKSSIDALSTNAGTPETFGSALYDYITKGEATTTYSKERLTNWMDAINRHLLTLGERSKEITQVQDGFADRVTNIETTLAKIANRLDALENPSGTYAVPAAPHAADNASLPDGDHQMGDVPRPAA
ncbi:hypothetical protein CONPUDRAFT_149397 [Coniophora puteana RWD-64-598 SS2]|uniref:Uncharacterized protein n=1 Tax=Coniophora puteana (strain RWD-64-598) TaxID=741705 RepID=A0A5M3N7S9_CONPW|nr:uncharacterized protein CONPUDRAFT_149397 [Coniophora puteana RWD-64-598 SS2]EIW87366.1 hypothetical protein CONPUDRAFT_149397 [Coniophora puteana RWD-64-598 SS2]